ncbi:MAG: hypothetical protein ACI808_001838 [Paraglaciecola sp.]
MNNSKLLWCLLGFQTLLILFLVFQTKSLNTQVQNLSAKTNTAIQNVSLSTPASDDGIVDNSEIHQAYNSPTIKEIRTVIAEELQNIETNRAMQANKIQENSAYITPEPSQDIIDQMSVDVSDMILALHGPDEVGASEIALIEQAIVKLPPAERRQALKELFKAVNSGQINTRF